MLHSSSTVSLPEDLESHFRFICALASVQDSSEGELVWLEAPVDHVLDQAYSLPKLHPSTQSVAGPSDYEHLCETALT